MADGGVTEAAIIGGMADAAAGTAATAGTAAATTAALSAAVPALTGAWAEAAAATLPAVAGTAATTAPAITAATAAPAISGGLLNTSAPIFLGTTESTPAVGGAVGGGSALGTGGTAATAAPVVAGNAADWSTVPAISNVGGTASGATGPTTSALQNAFLSSGGVPSSAWSGVDPSLGEQLGNWWANTSAGGKLQALSTLTGATGAAKSLASSGSSTPRNTQTIVKGSPGQPKDALGASGLGQLVQAMLQRRNQMLNSRLSGQPLVQQPGGLFGNF